MKYFKFKKKIRDNPIKFQIRETARYRHLSMPRKIFWKVNKPNNYYFDFGKFD
jgi:hypothetical protein